MIPKIIHQIWLGDQSKRPTELMNSIKLMNPDWEYYLWTDDNLPEDLTLRSRIDAIPDYEMPAKADLLRYELLYKFGGVYIDADSEAIIPFTEDLLENDSFACWENEYVICGWITNAYLGAIKGNYLMRKLVEKFYKMSIEDFSSMQHLSAAMITGPSALTEMIKSLQYTYTRIYPSHYFLPEHYLGIIQPPRYPTYTRHRFASTPRSVYNY